MGPTAILCATASRARHAHFVVRDALCLVGLASLPSRHAHIAPPDEGGRSPDSLGCTWVRREPGRLPGVARRPWCNTWLYPEMQPPVRREPGRLPPDAASRGTGQSAGAGGGASPSAPGPLRPAPGPGPLDGQSPPAPRRSHRRRAVWGRGVLGRYSSFVVSGFVRAGRLFILMKELVAH